MPAFRRPASGAGAGGYLENGKQLRPGPWVRPWSFLSGREALRKSRRFRFGADPS